MLWLCYSYVMDMVVSMSMSDQIMRSGMNEQTACVVGTRYTTGTILSLVLCVSVPLPSRSYCYTTITVSVASSALPYTRKCLSCSQRRSTVTASFAASSSACSAGFCFYNQLTVCVMLCVDMHEP